MNTIFKDLKVIELASVLAGPAVGMFFAELGAKVIKVENKKTGGDVTRSWRLPKEDKNAPVSAYYCAINWNKSVLFLDLSTAEDKAQLYALVETADIVIANYKKSSAQKMGVDYESLKAYNSKLIYANLSGFGEESNRVAFDVVLQAESGFMYMNGQPNTSPTKMPVALIDVLAAHQLKEGLLVALIQRMKTGKGSYVSTSLLESAVSSLANQATNWLMGGHIPQQMGSLHPNIAPYGELFETADKKQVVLSIGSNKQFQQLCRVLKREDLAKAKAYQTNGDRVSNRQELAVELQKTIQNIGSSLLLEQSHERQVPIGLVRNMQEVFELPETQDLILREDIDGQATQRVKTVVFKVD